MGEKTRGVWRREGAGKRGFRPAQGVGDGNHESGLLWYSRVPVTEMIEPGGSGKRFPFLICSFPRISCCRCHMGVWEMNVGREDGSKMGFMFNEAGVPEGACGPTGQDSRQGNTGQAKFWGLSPPLALKVGFILIRF